jgi:hypothetical protein
MSTSRSPLHAADDDQMARTPHFGSQNGDDAGENVRILSFSELVAAMASTRSSTYFPKMNYNCNIFMKHMVMHPISAWTFGEPRPG